jgi:hypothetical protein
METKEFILHEHVPQDQSTLPPKTISKKHKWVPTFAGPEAESMFVTFHTRTQTSTQVTQANRRLRLAGLDAGILDEKYKDVNDMLICIVDLEGVCLWINGYGQEMFGRHKPIVGGKLRDEIVNMNSTSKEFLTSRFRFLYETLPETMDFQAPLVSGEHEWNWRVHYEKLDTLKGTPFAYTCYARNSQINEHVKQPKTKLEVIEQSFVDSGLDFAEVISKYVEIKSPVFCLNLIERVLWMNFTFQDVFNRSEKDLLDIFSPPYGFESFERGWENVLVTIPQNYEFQNLEFQRIDGSNGKPMAYMVIFHTLKLTMPEKSNKVECEEILLRVKLSRTVLDEQCKWSDRGCIVLGRAGCLLYMNDVFRKLTKLDDNRLMTHWTHEAKELNPHLRDILDTVFIGDLPEKLVFLTDFTYTPTSLTQRKTRFEFQRIDKDGFPYAYYAWLDLIV